MIERSLALTEAHPNPLQRIVERVEEELDRLRRNRPGLGERLDRAANILVVHLSCPRQRVIRVRVRNDQPRFLVASLGSSGGIYVVSPNDWSCSCPDFHRRGGEGPCKHALACYVLRRAVLPTKKKKGVRSSTSCDGCERRFPRRDLIELTQENHDNLTHFHGDLLCRVCAEGAGVCR